MITLEFSKRSPLRIWAKQGDTGRELEFQCISNSIPIDLIGCTIVLNMTKPIKVFVNATIVNAVEGKIKINLTSDMLSQKGKYEADISIFNGDGKIISSANFELDVDSSQRDDEAIEASDEFSALLGAMGDIATVKSQLAEIESEFDEVLANVTVDSEVINARVNSKSVTYTTLKQRLDAFETQEAWITPTLLNGWQQNSVLSSVGYRKDNFGVVSIKGGFTGGSANTVIFTLPVGYRPPKLIYYPIITGANIILLKIGSTGSVEIQGTPSAWVDLGFIQFSSV